MITIFLSIEDRFNVRKLFLDKCSMVTATLQKDIGRKMDLSQEEMTEIDFKVIGSAVQWNVAKAKEKEIELSLAELKLLQSQITTLDKTNQLEYAALDTFLKIKEAKEANV